MRVKCDEDRNRCVESVRQNADGFIPRQRMNSSLQHFAKAAIRIAKIKMATNFAIAIVNLTRSSVFSGEK